MDCDGLCIVHNFFSKCVVYCFLDKSLQVCSFHSSWQVQLKSFVVVSKKNASTLFEKCSLI